jgi:hypothetical protein
MMLAIAPLVRLADAVTYRLDRVIQTAAVAVITVRIPIAIGV